MHESMLMIQKLEFQTQNIKYLKFQKEECLRVNSFERKEKQFILWIPGLRQGSYKIIFYFEHLYKSKSAQNNDRSTSQGHGS